MGQGPTGGGRGRRALVASWEARGGVGSGSGLAGGGSWRWAGRRDTNSRSYELAGARWGGSSVLTAVVSARGRGRAAVGPALVGGGRLPGGGRTCAQVSGLRPGGGRNGGGVPGLRPGGGS
jgi:hypothetical protein